jgi:hypothetical protein
MADEGFLSGLLSTPDNTNVDPTTGMTEAQRQQAIYGTFGNLGALLMAAGQKQMPSERAKYLAQIGNIPGQLNQQLTDAQKLLMQKQQFQTTQALQKQQLASAELANKQAQAASEALNTPEFKAQFDALPAPQKAVIEAARAKGDYATINNVLKELQPKPDANGNVFDPKTNSIFNIFTGISRTLPGAPNATNAPAAANAPVAGGETLTGDEFMKTLPEGGFRNVVQSIVNGNAVMPTNTRSPYWIQVQQAVQQADPTFSINDASARKRFVDNSATGDLAKLRNNLGTFANHLVGGLEKSIALKTGDFVPGNAAQGEYFKVTGDPRVAAFNTEVHAMMGEAGKMIKAGVVTNQEMRTLESNISSSSSPAQLRGVLDAFRDLVQGRIESTDSSGQMIMGKAWDPKKYSVMNPAAQSSFEKYENNQWARPPKPQERPMGADIPMSAIKALNENPGLRDQFNKKYGQGKDIASSILGQ